MGIGFIDLNRFRHMAFALAALGGKQVPARSVVSLDFARGGNFEPFRD
jgi:hypothetical protein